MRSTSGKASRTMRSEQPEVKTGTGPESRRLRLYGPGLVGLVVGEEGAQELVERGPVAARERRRRERGHRSRPRHVHHERDLTEVVAGTEHATRAEPAGIAHGEQSFEDDVEVVAFVTLQDDRGAGSDLAAAHAPRELRQLLAGKLPQKPDLGQLGDRGGFEPGHEAIVSDRVRARRGGGLPALWRPGRGRRRPRRVPRVRPATLRELQAN